MLHQIALRDVVAEDEPFLWNLYSAGRWEELSLAPWDESRKLGFLRVQYDAQTTRHRTTYPLAKHQIILLGSKPVGRLSVERRADEIRILDITLLPEHRNKGIGSFILQNLQEEAAQAFMPLRILVDTKNRSLSFFQRLNFRILQQDALNYLMEWSRK